jgi:hypothetical protein
VVLVAGMGRPSGVAAADDKVPLGGGAGIIVNGTYCTLGTIGYDGSGELVGFTSSRCGGPGSQVAAEGSGVGVGSVVAASGDPKYAVIKLDPNKVARLPPLMVSRSTALAQIPLWDNGFAHTAALPAMSAVQYLFPPLMYRPLWS